MPITYKTKPSSFSLGNVPRFYFLLLFMIIFLLTYWFHPSSINKKTTSYKQIIADASHLPQSPLFTYLNLSGQIYLNETQGLLFVPTHDRPAHFASINIKGVRGNHRHKDTENAISGEVIILLDGQFQFRIGDGDTGKYEDHQFNVSQTGVVAVQFTADKCHALKNIGKQTCWFVSYYIKLKDFVKPFVDKDGCAKMALT